MSTNNITEFEKWVARNSRSSSPSSRSGESTPILIAMSMLAAGQPVVSNSSLVGQNAQQALQDDQKYVSERNTPQGQSILALLPTTGCAMVLSLAQQASGYNPADPSAAGNLQGFLSYVEQVMACPIFDTILHDQINLNLSGDWNTMVNSIVGCYQGIADAELTVIRNSLWSIAQAAASSPNTNETDNLFVQNTLNSEDNINVYIYKSYVTMREEQYKGSGKNAPTTTTNQAAFQLWRTALNFNATNWPAYSKIIMPKTDASLNSWLTNNSTPQGKIPVNWNC